MAPGKIAVAPRFNRTYPAGIHAYIARVRRLELRPHNRVFLFAIAAMEERFVNDGAFAWAAEGKSSTPRRIWLVGTEGIISIVRGCG